MTVWAAVLFAAAALGGAVMVVQRLGERKIPMGLALLHGLAAASGLVLLLLAVLQGAAAGLATIALVLFVLAALGGFYLFASYLRTGSFPVPVMFVHAGVAVLAFLLLVFWLLA